MTDVLFSVKTNVLSFDGFTFTNKSLLFSNNTHIGIDTLQFDTVLWGPYSALVGREQFHHDSILTQGLGLWCILMWCMLLRQKLCHYCSGAIWEIGLIPPQLEFSLKISCIFSFFLIPICKIHLSPSLMVVATIDCLQLCLDAAKSQCWFQKFVGSTPPLPVKAWWLSSLCWVSSEALVGINFFHRLY